jgi:DNA invertase Pin-like site-specific DNA recombinase
MEPMKKYVAYYRVSTDRQGASGLGLDAQRDAVARYVGAGQLIADFTEIESGRNNQRPQLATALETCRKQRAVLVIARLDRLARNVAFISNLMESGVEFIAVDMPQANRLTIHILAAVAEHERDMIAQRTKAALAQAKARGTRLGNPRPLEALKHANAATAHLRPLPEILQLVTGLRDKGDTLRSIADHLNRLGLRTPRGKSWYASTVNSLIQAPLVSVPSA